MIHTNRIRKSKKKLQYGGQLYDILPEYKDGFVDYKGVDSGIILNTAVQLQSQYDKILNEKKEALKSIRDAKVHTIYNGLKTQLSDEILNANKNLLERSNNDVLSPIYSQGIMNVVDEKMNGREWTAALGNSPQLEEYEASKQRMLEKGNVQNYDDPNLPVYNEMVKGNNIYNPFVPRGIYETPDYDATFDAVAKNFPAEELSAFLPIKTTDSAGNVTYEPFDVVQMDTKIKSELGLKTRYETMLNNFYTTAAGASFARKVAQDLNLPPNPDGSVNMTDPTFKAEYNKQVLEMMSKAAIRNQAYAETAKMTTMTGKLNQYQFEENLKYQSEQAQANRDQQMEIARMNAQSREDIADGKSNGTSTGTTSSSKNTTPKAEKPDLGLFGDIDPNIKTSTSYSIEENNGVSYSIYKVNSEKAEIKYKNLLSATANANSANNIEIAAADGVVYTGRNNYDNTNKATMYEDLVNYYDKNNSLDGLKVKYNGNDIDGQSSIALNESVKQLLIEKKMKESARESVTSLNKNAFDALKKVRVNNTGVETLYRPMTGHSDMLYDKSSNKIAWLTSTGDIKLIDIEKAKDMYKTNNVDEIADKVHSFGINYNDAIVQNPNVQDTSKYIEQGKLNFLSKIGYTQDITPIIDIEQGNSSTKLALNDKYNNLKSEEKTQLDRAYILSEEYKQANLDAEKAFQLTGNGISTDIVRKLNEESKRNSVYNITNQDIVLIPNELTTKEDTDNKVYFNTLRSIKSTLINSPSDLSLSMYELNTESSHKGITPTYWDALKEKSVKYVNGLGVLWGKNSTNLNSPDIVLTGITRDDKLGACFYGNIKYDITSMMTGDGEKKQDIQNEINTIINSSDGALKIQKGQDGATYLIHNTNFLVQSEIANKELYKKELNGSNESEGVANQYSLLVKGFSNNELTTLKLDTYSSTNDIKIEKHVDSNYDLKYRLYWSDINGEKNYQEFTNLSDVAKVTYNYNKELQQLDNIATNHPNLVNINTNTPMTATQNQMLVSVYSNIVQPTQYQAYSNVSDRKEYLSKPESKLFYKPTSSNTLEFIISPDSNVAASSYLLKTIREISNIQSNTNGIRVNIDPNLDTQDKSKPLDSNSFTTLQKDILRKYFGSDVIITYNNHKLTISRVTQ